MRYTYYYTSFDALFVYLAGALVFSTLLLSLCYIIASANSNYYYEKSSGYECGFDPFSDAREPFYVKFYLISILFIIFDVEVVFMLPWVLCMQQVGMFGFYILYFFILILSIGFAYEWKKGSLDWD